jgi:hypothetical protein
VLEWPIRIALGSLRQAAQLGSDQVESLYPARPKSGRLLSRHSVQQNPRAYLTKVTGAILPAA